MFRLTSSAAATLLEACQAEGMSSESAGGRVGGTVDESGTLSLEIMLQEEPEPADQVSDQEGIRVFVAPRSPSRCRVSSSTSPAETRLPRRLQDQAPAANPERPPFAGGRRRAPFASALRRSELFGDADVGGQVAGAESRRG